MKSLAPKQTQKQMLMFVLTGVINAAVDLGLLNLLIFVAKMPLIPANLIAVSVALVVSYIDNSYFVFKNSELRNLRLIGMYLGVTVFGLYGIETLILYTLTHSWLLPGHFAFWVITKVGLTHVFNQHFVKDNTAKIIAAFVAAVWDFFIYKHFVFKNNDEVEPNLAI